MKRVRRGFTLIEVSLFLAITTAVFVGVAIGTQNSIFQQRYNDAVQNFVEFLRTEYSQVTNVQSGSTGRSDNVIYGKLVIFGANADGGNEINSYNIIGNIEVTKPNCVEENVLGKLYCRDANILNDNVDNYVPRWSSRIQDTNGWGDGYQLFKGALLIVRSPDTGTVQTYISSEQLNMGDGDPFSYINEEGNGRSRLTDGSFVQGDVDFCVNPNGAGRSNLRRDVRIINGARNTSGIEIMPDSQESGNRCRQ